MQLGKPWKISQFVLVEQLTTLQPMFGSRNAHRRFTLFVTFF